MAPARALSIAGVIGNVAVVVRRRGAPRGGVAAAVGRIGGGGGRGGDVRGATSALDEPLAVGIGGGFVVDGERGDTAWWLEETGLEEAVTTGVWEAPEGLSATHVRLPL
jgi:hypothetical protein